MNGPYYTTQVKSHHAGADDPFKCSCTPSCRSIKYDVSYGASTWPGEGPELWASYDKIVKQKVIPYYKQLNSTMAEHAVRYFERSENARDIMRNFVRLTVYIKDLTVHTTEQVPAYSTVDLLSDIGWYNYIGVALTINDA